MVPGNISRKGDPANDQVGTRESFQPLMVQEAERAAEFLGLTRACTRQHRIPGDARIDRNVTSEEAGGQETDLEAERLDLREQTGKVRCHNLLDKLPPAFFDPGRYIFETLPETAQQIRPTSHQFLWPSCALAWLAPAGVRAHVEARAESRFSAGTKVSKLGRDAPQRRGRS